MSMQDSVKVLEEFGSRLGVAQRRRPELKLGDRIELVDRADRGAVELLQALETWYLKDLNADAGERTHVWDAISQYCTRVERAYLYLARQFQTYSHGWAEVRDWIPIVVARAFRAPFRPPLPTVPSEMLENMDYCPHIVDRFQVHILGLDFTGRDLGDKLVDMLHDPAGTEKPRARAHYRNRGIALRGRPSIEVDEKIASLGWMSLQFEAIRQVLDDAKGNIDFQRWQAVSGGDCQHHRS